MKQLAYLLSVTLFFLSTQSFAGQGKAYVPYWKGQASGSGSNGTKLWISNITNHTVTVDLTFYDSDGNEVSPTFSDGFVNGNQLAPKTTVHLKIDHADKFGHGLISWSNTNANDDDAVALIAHGNRTEVSTTYRFGAYGISINNGLPF
ncbi:hypothetical protein LJ739_18995 [Aestuariibacter halophilus]|uniref:Uncharacterized protein n=1 Tax=Fluctibacter halophilus TaxID=226011 RepID=A0ABS8GD92_9ALTE|nr:hypothetical protein [Aestuariibacter halophilus]MCC2618348.1 hypothetical protein [Aestuariibacter halophilus]